MNICMTDSYNSLMSAVNDNASLDDFIAKENAMRYNRREMTAMLINVTACVWIMNGPDNKSLISVDKNHYKVVLIKLEGEVSSPSELVNGKTFSIHEINIAAGWEFDRFATKPEMKTLLEDHFTDLL